MCLGSGGSSKPALQQRTLPAEGVRPADESAKPQQRQASKAGNALETYHPSAMASAAQREWAEKGDLTESPTLKRNDSGINL